MPRRRGLSVLSALAHGRDEAGVAAHVGLAALAAVARLDEAKALFYTDLVMAALSEAARRALEASMRAGYEYQSEFARKYFGQGMREAIRLMIERRFGPLTPEQLERLDTTHPDELIDRILAARSLEELLDQ